MSLERVGYDGRSMLLLLSLTKLMKCCIGVFAAERPDDNGSQVPSLSVQETAGRAAYHTQPH